MYSETFAISLRRNSRASGRSTRKVPPASASGAITFSAAPPRIHPTETTALSIGSMRRLTSCWSATTVCVSATIGSRARCGYAACPPAPSIRIRKLSLDAFTGPPSEVAAPHATSGCTCTATTLSRPSSAPSSSRRRAPDGYASSLGWNSATSGAGNSGSSRRAARTSAVSAAVCTSWPQPCIAPFVAANDAPLDSSIGSPSSSARTPIPGAAACPTAATSPVPHTRRTVAPPSACATDAAVASSCQLRSGDACSCSRSERAAGSSSSRAASNVSRSSSTSLSVHLRVACTCVVRLEICHELELFSLHRDECGEQLGRKERPDDLVALELRERRIE